MEHNSIYKASFYTFHTHVHFELEIAQARLLSFLHMLHFMFLQLLYAGAWMEAVRAQGHSIWSIFQ